MTIRINFGKLIISVKYVAIIFYEEISITGEKYENKKNIITILIIILTVILILILFSNNIKNNIKDKFIGEYRISEIVFTNYSPAFSNPTSSSNKEIIVPNLKYIIEENRVAVIYELDEKFDYKNYSNYFIHSGSSIKYYSPITFKTVALDKEYKYLDVLEGNFMSKFNSEVIKQKDINNSYALIVEGGSINEDSPIYTEYNEIKNIKPVFYFINNEYYTDYNGSCFKLEKVK